MVMVYLDYVSRPFHARSCLDNTLFPVMVQGRAAGGVFAASGFPWMRPAMASCPLVFFLPHAANRLYFPTCRSQPVTSSCCRVSLRD